MNHKHWMFISVLFASVSVQAAEPVGEFLWPSGVAQPEMGPDGLPLRFFFPDVPFGGQSDPSGAITAILDSGIDLSHPQIQGYVIEAKDFTGEGINDELGHGTAVVLRWLSFTLNTDLPFRPGGLLIGKIGGKEKPRVQTLMDAIRWAVSHGARTINLSVGFIGPAEHFDYLCALITAQRSKGVWFSAAAGNYGPYVPVYPAACKSRNMMSTYATDQQGKPTDTSGIGSIGMPDTQSFIYEWEYWMHEGDRRNEAGKKLEARRMYEKSLNSKPSPGVYVQLGNIDADEGKISDAIKHYRMAIDLNPSYGLAYRNLGITLGESGDLVEAENALSEAVRLEPQEGAAHYNLAEVYRLTAQYEKMMKEIEELLRVDPEYYQSQSDGIAHMIQSVVNIAIDATQ